MRAIINGTGHTATDRGTIEGGTVLIEGAEHVFVGGEHVYDSDRDDADHRDDAW